MSNLRYVAATLVVAAMWTGPGCSQAPAPTSTRVTKSPTAQATSFAAGPLGAKVENLKGVPYFSASTELTGALTSPPSPGAYFLFLPPADPGHVLLVCAPSSTPDQISKLKSGAITLTGPVKRFKDAGFKKTVKDKFQLDLITEGDDIPVVLAEGDVTPPSPTPGPDEAPPPATSTPAATAATSTPAATPAK